MKRSVRTQGGALIDTPVVLLITRTVPGVPEQQRSCLVLVVYICNVGVVCYFAFDAVSDVESGEWAIKGGGRG